MGVMKEHGPSGSEWLRVGSSGIEWDGLNDRRAQWARTGRVSATSVPVDMRRTRALPP